LGEQVGGGNEAAGAAGAKEFEVRKIAALVLASAAGFLGAASSASTTDTLVSNAAWWEKVTVTIDGDGKPQSCLYQSSLKPSDPEACDVASSAAAAASKSADSKGQFTRITFERRFDPGAPPAKADLQTGDTLLGGQMMALAIDGRGTVKGCHIVASSGAMRPDYSCDDAQAEKFQASVGGAPKTERQGYMTIIVFGHSEHMV
jgi:hypothetical protein